MSFDIDADPDDLRRMADQLRAFATSVEVTSQEIGSLLSNIEWDDSRFQEFRSNMQPVLTMLSNSVDQAQSTRMYVEEKAQILENYLGGR
jgi:DNA repair ATPase RecN